MLPAKTFDLQANDPRLLYDPITRRWFAWVQGVDPANGYLAVSATSDPTQEWRGVKMPFPPHNYGARIGFDLSSDRRLYHVSEGGITVIEGRRSAVDIGTLQV